jgi:hypothetical protein
MNMSDQIVRDEMPKLHVFISHAGEDMDIAIALRDAIAKLGDPNNVDVFLDYDHIDPGSEISDTIKGSLCESDFFIGIATHNLRNQFSWCGLELGYFLAGRKENGHINYLFHNEIQDVFRPYLGTKIVGLDQRPNKALPTSSKLADAPIYRLLLQIGVEASRRSFPKDPFKFFDSLRAAAAAGALAVTAAYDDQLVLNAKKVRYPQGKISVAFPPGLTPDELSKWIGQAKVSIYPRAAYALQIPELSDARPAEMDWFPFVERMKDISGGPYLSSIIYDIIEDFLPSQFNAKNDYLFQAPEKHTFRVILVRYELFGDGRSEFIFNLIETLEPLKGGDPKTTLITSAIVLATQFRSLFIENDATYAVKTLEGLPEDGFVSTIKDLLRDLRRMHIESATLGLTEEALKAALGSPKKIQDWFAKWWPMVAKLDDAANAYMAARAEPNKAALLSTLRDMIEQTSPVNRAFTSLCLQVYKQIIDGGA